jgi:hypothetical protein
VIEALGAAALMVGLCVDALLSVWAWWLPLLLAALGVGVWLELRPTGRHRGSRAGRPALAAGPEPLALPAADDVPDAVQAPTGGETDTMPLAVPAPPQTRPEHVEGTGG